MAQQTRASSSPKERFDSNGARKAAIAFLTAIYKTGRHGTIAEVLIALEVIDSNLDGRPHSMKSLSSKLGIPYTSVSRIVYSLTSEGQKVLVQQRETWKKFVAAISSITGVSHA